MTCNQILFLIEFKKEVMETKDEINNRINEQEQEVDTLRFKLKTLTLNDKNDNNIITK